MHQQGNQQKNVKNVIYYDEKLDNSSKQAASTHGNNTVNSDMLVDFPTNGGSDQFKIDNNMVSPLIHNRNSHYAAFAAGAEEKGTMSVQIFLNMEFDFGNGPELLKMTDEFPPSQMTIDSMIQTAVMVFNEKLETKDSKQRINPQFSIWNLYMSKKNGRPKQDLPALDRDNLLSESGQIDMFTLDTKDSDKIWEVTSTKWIEYKKKEEDGEDENQNDRSFEDKKNNNNKRSENQENKNTEINTQASITPNNRNSDLITSVNKTKKPTKDVSTGCSGLCSFSSPSKNKKKK